MLLCYCNGLGKEQNEIDLCFVPDKADGMTRPFRVRDIRVTASAVYRIGPEETLIAKFDPEGSGIIFEPIPPAGMYLTPNLSVQPGFRVKKVRISVGADGFKTFFDQERGKWEEWVANKDR
jgi:hypothetical protein